MQGVDEELREEFHAAGRRLTSQRWLIFRLLREAEEHLDAEGVYRRAKTLNPDISLATVYRTLGVLKEMGLVEEHRLGQEHGHYEAVREGPHYHFTCLGCGRVIEFDSPAVAEIETALEEREGVCVLRTHLHISGYCAECQDKVGGQNRNDEPS